jgi:hypothetical protein
MMGCTCSLLRQRPKTNLARKPSKTFGRNANRESLWNCASNRRVKSVGAGLRRSFTRYRALAPTSVTSAYPAWSSIGMSSGGETTGTRVAGVSATRASVDQRQEECVRDLLNRIFRLLRRARRDREDGRRAASVRAAAQRSTISLVVSLRPALRAARVDLGKVLKEE